MLRLLRTGKGPMDGWIARAYDHGVQSAFRDILPALVRDMLEDVRSVVARVGRVIDVGCGPGQFTILMAEELLGVETWGVDLAPAMIALARQHAAESSAAARLHFEVADAAHLPFPNDHFGAVLSSGSIKHWEDPVAGLREIHRVLVPGGHAFIGEMNRVAPARGIDANRAHLRSRLFRFVYPRVFAKALSPDEARQVFAASPFGAPRRERMLLDDCFWLFEAAKA